MVTKVTDNSVRQINAALVSAQREIDALRALIVGLKKDAETLAEELANASNIRASD